MFGKLFNNLKNGLTKTRNALTDKINEALNLAVTIDDDLYEELEEILIMADIGMDTTMEIIERLKDKIRKDGREKWENSNYKKRNCWNDEWW